MNRDYLKQAIKATIRAVPEVRKYLSYKNYNMYETALQSIVEDAYTGNMSGGDFISTMYAYIDAGLTDAYESALQDNGMALDEMTDDMRQELQSYIESENTRVVNLWNDIQAGIHGDPPVPISSFMSRAELWANRWNDVYNAAMLSINSQLGERLEWVLGATEQHCTTCSALNGIVAFASEWEESGARPQNPPNDILECGGWKCDCSLSPTDKRRSPKALDTIINIVAGSQL